MHGGNPNWSFKHLTAAKIVALQPASRTRDLICFTPSRPMCKTIAVFGRANERVLFSCSCTAGWLYHMFTVTFTFRILHQGFATVIGVTIGKHTNYTASELLLLLLLRRQCMRQVPEVRLQGTAAATFAVGATSNQVNSPRCCPRSNLCTLAWKRRPVFGFPVGERGKRRWGKKLLQRW